MNILIVFPSLSYRGGERVFYTLAKGLVAQGHSVKIIVGRVEKKHLKIKKPVELISPPEWLNQLMQNNFLFIAFGLFPLFFQIYRHSRGIDLINTESGFSLWASVLVGKIRKLKVVWTVFAFEQEPFSLYSSKKTTLGLFSPHPGEGLRPLPECFYGLNLEMFVWAGIGLFSKIFRQWDGFFARRADGVICIAPRIKRRVEKFYRIKDVEVIIPAVDLSRFRKFNLAEVKQRYRLADKRILLLPGTLHHKKNQGLAINALARVVKDFPSVVLLLTGDGPEEKSLRFKVQSLNLRCKVIFTGVVSEEVLASLFKAADLILVSSRTENEGLSLTALEALANGKLPVVTNLAGVAEILSQKKIGLVTPLTVESFSQAILSYLQNPGKYEKMIERGKKWVLEELSVEKFTRRTLEVFEK